MSTLISSLVSSKNKCKILRELTLICLTFYFIRRGLSFEKSKVVFEAIHDL